MNKQKQTYVSPETETLVIRFEGVVCKSPNGAFDEQGNVNDHSGDDGWWN